MPLSPMGILHTILGVVAIISVLSLLWQNKQISVAPMLGKIYLLATVTTAASALTIFKHGGFNTAHALAILTIAAVVAGLIIEKTQLFKLWSIYLTNLCYSATILFHALPTATEIMTRFPMENPLAASLKDPLLQSTFKVIFVVFVVLLISQMMWLRKQAKVVKV